MTPRALKTYVCGTGVWRMSHNDPPPPSNGNTKTAAPTMRLVWLFLFVFTLSSPITKTFSSPFVLLRPKGVVYRGTEHYFWGLLKIQISTQYCGERECHFEQRTDNCERYVVTKLFVYKRAKRRLHCIWFLNWFPSIQIPNGKRLVKKSCEFPIWAFHSTPEAYAYQPSTSINPLRPTVNIRSDECTI